MAATVTVQGMPWVRRSVAEIIAGNEQATKDGLRSAATVAVNQERAALGNPKTWRRAKGRHPGRLAASMRVGKPKKLPGRKGFRVAFGPMGGPAGSAAAFAGAGGAKSVRLYRAVQNAGDPGRRIPGKHYIGRGLMVAQARMGEAFRSAWEAQMKARGLA